ncbi:MAG: glycosyl hydrolase 53 family protein [Flavobacterium sp.]|nr:glycosyl hydrolase 53 family protein [Flavobacterium sp.]
MLQLLSFLSCNKSNDNPVLSPQNNNNNPQSIFFKGMDLSFQMEFEKLNLDYKDINNNPIVVLDFAKQKGCNLVRLELWKNPPNNQNTLEKVKLYALKL